MEDAKIVIIGGGVVGASVAYHLTERGCQNVTVLERESSLGLGSTGKATGGVRAQFETDINIKLSLYSLDFFNNWDHDCGYDPRGYLFLATNDEQFEYLKRTSARQRELGYDGVNVVDSHAIAAMVPQINCEDIVGGTFGPRDGFIDPLAVLDGFASRAKAKGTRFETTQNVTSLNVENGRVRSVPTVSGDVECDAVVLCAGAWASDLARTAGIDLPVEPLRRQIVWAKTGETLSPTLPMVIDMSNGFHFRPARDSHDELLFAYADKDETPTFSLEFDESFIDKVYEKARHRAPFLAETQVIDEKCRAGLYENSPDHHAILGACEVGGLYFANGFSGHGVMHSPSTGRALAEIILDGEASFLDVSSLSIDRFAKGELLYETAFI